MIEPLTEEAVDEVVAIHLRAFPDFFLSQLGARFLRLYYRSLARDRESLVFVFRDDAGRAAGFVAGAMNPRGFYRRLLMRAWWRFGLAALPAVFGSPRRVRRVLRGVKHPGQNPEGSDTAGLLSLAVDPSVQGGGVGRQLVGAFLDEARRRRAMRVFLTTDKERNDSVNRFYERCGFRVQREFTTPEGRQMNEYWLCIPTDAAGDPQPAVRSVPSYRREDKHGL